MRLRVPEIYLAGPITGLEWYEITGWRNKVQQALHPDIVCYTPLRGKEYLENIGKVPVQLKFDHPYANQRFIFARDWNDATRRDLLFANLLMAKRVSIGTVMEIAGAHASRVPIVLVMEKSGNIHQNPLLEEACPFRTDSLNEAIEMTRSILLP